MKYCINSLAALAAANPLSPCCIPVSVSPGSLGCVPAFHVEPDAPGWVVPGLPSPGSCFGWKTVDGESVDAQTCVYGGYPSAPGDLMGTLSLVLWGGITAHLMLLCGRSSFEPMGPPPCAGTCLPWADPALLPLA